MTSRLFAVILATLAGCGANRPAATAPPAPAPAPGSASAATTTATTPAATAARPRAQIGAWGFDAAGMDPSVAPGASFFQYANGRWLASCAAKFCIRKRFASGASTAS